MAHLAEVLQVVDTRGVDKRHAAHTDNAHLGVAVEARHQVLELVGDAEEVRAVDFVHLHTVGDNEVFLVHLRIGLFVRVDFVGNHLNLRCLRHALHEEQAGDEQTHLDGNREVEDNGEQEGDNQHRDVALRVFHQLEECAPAAHVVRHDYQHAGEARHGNIGGEGHQQQEDEQQHGGVDNARHGRAAAVVDVCHRAGNGTRAGNAAEERRADIGNALADEFLVAVVVVAAHTVGHRGGEQRLDGAQHGNHHRRGQQRLNALPRDVGHREGRDNGLDFAETVSDGRDVHAVGIGVYEVYAHRHQDNRQQRAGYFFRYLRGEGDDEDTEYADAGSDPVNRADVFEIECPFREEVARHLARYRQSEEVFYLRGENGEGDTAREAHHDGVGDKLNDGAEAEESQQDKEHAGEHRGNHQARQTELWIAYDAVNNNYECTRRAADLHAAATEGGHEETADDGGEDALRGRHARGDTEGNGKRQRHNADNQARHEVGHELFFVVMPQVFEKARRKYRVLHNCFVLLILIYWLLSSKKVQS